MSAFYNDSKFKQPWGEEIAVSDMKTELSPKESKLSNNNSQIVFRNNRNLGRLSVQSNLSDKAVPQQNLNIT